LKHKPSPEGGSSEEKPSRTQKKKRADALQRLGMQLLSLTKTQLNDLQLPPEMVEAVLDAKKMSTRGALRRQKQYIGSLMRQTDAVRLQQELDRLTLQSRHAGRSTKPAEQGRDESLKEDR
jgi:ribosome-associated protein